MEEADNDTKSDPQEFRRVTRELHERLDRPPKGGRTVWGGAFHVSFAESSEEDSDSKQGTEQAPPKGKEHKRSGTQLLETTISKKEVTECPACNLRGHSLAECWSIFEKLKPQGMKSSAYRVRRAKKKVDEDEQLTAEVQEIHQKMEKKAKKTK